MIASLLLLLQAAPAAQPVAPTSPAKEKITCRTFQVTGSLIGTKKVCGTAAQWRERERDTQEMIDKIQQTSAQPAGK